MTKQKSTKRALLLSALSLLICVSMLIGSTFAWFTDSVTSTGNIIKSGTLDVTMEWADGTKAVPADDSSDWTDASIGAIFKSELWEPGYTEVRHIKIANEGTLALKYQLNIIANGEVSKLADVIDVYYVDPAVQVVDRAALTADKKLGTLTEVLAKISTTASGNLAAGENHTVTLALKMQESAGNEYQDLSIGSEFAVQLMATQLTSENDSFDNQYDNITMVSTADELKAAVEAGGNVMLMNDIAITDWNAAIAKNVETSLYLNGNKISATSTQSGANYTVFSVAAGGVLNIVGEGTVEVFHVGDNMEWNNMTAIAHAYGDINVSNGANIINYGGTDMAFGLTGYIGCDFTIEDSTVASTYCAVRVQNGTTNPTESNVTVSGSSLISYSWARAFWHHVGTANSGPVNLKGIESEDAATAAGNTIYGSVREGDTVIWVGGEAGEYATAENQTEFREAIATAQDGGVIYMSAGSYSLPSVNNGNVTISGNEDTVITVNKPNCTGADVTFNGVTVKGSGYATGVQHVNTVTYNDATIVGVMCLYGEKVVFNNCTFDLTAVTDYIWTYGAKEVVFNDCTFNTNGKAILIYNEGADLVTNVSVKGCTFNATKTALASGNPAAAIEIDSSLATNGHYTLVTENNTVDSDFAGEWRIKKSGTNNTTVNGTVYNAVTIDGSSVTY